MKLSKTYCFTLLCLVLSAKMANSQNSLLTDKTEYHSGDTIQITFKCSSDKIKTTCTDQVYAVFSSTTTRLSGRRDVVEQTFLNDSMRSFKWIVPEDVCYVSISTQSFETFNTRESLGFRITNRKGAPLRGSYIAELDNTNTNIDELLNAELKYFPDNYSAYTSYWVWLPFQKKENYQAIIQQQIKELDGIRNQTAELLMAKSFGQLILGNIAECEAEFKKLMEHFPGSPLIATLLDKIQNQFYQRQTNFRNPEQFEQTLISFMKKNGANPVGRGKMYLLFKDAKANKEAIINSCNYWIKEEPDNPKPYCFLAMVYKEAGDREKAKTFADIAALKFFNDIARIKYLVWNVEYPYYNLQLAKVYAAIGEFAGAVGLLKTSVAIKGRYTAEHFLISGSVWKAAKMYAEAENEFVNALVAGNQSAGDSLKSIYALRNGKIESYNEWISQKMIRASQSGQGERAQDFSASNLKGEKIVLSQLKGKIVVLNFWYTSCVPCIREMPGLNKLVEEYKGKDVVFIAIALDKREAIIKFMEKHPFNYAIIPEGQVISDKYKVSGYPLNMIVDHNGNIIYRGTGGHEEVYKELGPIINSLLQIK